MYTPPVAVTSYVAARIVGASFDETNKALIPFLIVSLVAIVILLHCTGNYYIYPGLSFGLMEIGLPFILLRLLLLRGKVANVSFIFAGFKFS